MKSENTDNALVWSLKKFGELTLDELYGVLKLRSDVFVVEQQAVYHDLDMRDQQCVHLFARDGEGRFAAYMRILPRGVESADYGSLGRVVVCRQRRLSGLGAELFRRGIEAYDRIVGAEVPLKIHAQAYLVKFYGKFGFTPLGEVHDFEGLPHIWMMRRRVDA